MGTAKSHITTSLKHILRVWTTVSYKSIRQSDIEINQVANKSFAANQFPVSTSYMTALAQEQDVSLNQFLMRVTGLMCFCSKNWM
jgi:hypothetical protein